MYVAAQDKRLVCFDRDPRTSVVKSSPLPQYAPFEQPSLHQNGVDQTHIVPPLEFSVHLRGLMDVSELGALPVLSQDLHVSKSVGMDCQIADIEPNGAISVH
jgi:hypothetical protein